MQQVSSAKTWPKASPAKARRQPGFSLIETMIAVSIMLIASAIFFISAQPALRDTRTVNAYNITLSMLRRAREAAIAERRTYIITLNDAVTPNTITMTQAATGTVIDTVNLPSDVVFRAEAGIPTTIATTPDHFGTGSPAIDFDQGVAGGAKNVVYFNPDGSAQDVNSNTNNGVVYIARAGELYSSRAITVWGTTGRLRGYRLYPNAGGPVWRQQ